MAIFSVAIVACLLMCLCVRSISRLHTCVHARPCTHCTRAYMRTRRHAPARVRAYRACLPVPACRPSKAMPVCYARVLYRFPTELACLCWSLLYAHVCTHVCTGIARTHGTHAMVAHVCTHVCTSCLTRTQAHAHAPVTRPGAKSGTCLSKYNPFQTSSNQAVNARIDSAVGGGKGGCKRQGLEG